MASQKYNILYGRLSQEDERQGESNSIHNQKLFLEKYAADNGFENTLFLADDGYMEYLPPDKHLPLALQVILPLLIIGIPEGGHDFPAALLPQYGHLWMVAAQNAGVPIYFVVFFHIRLSSRIGKQLASAQRLLPSWFFFVIVLFLTEGDFLLPLPAERFLVCVMVCGGCVPYGIRILTALQRADKPDQIVCRTTIPTIVPSKISASHIMTDIAVSRLGGETEISFFFPACRNSVCSSATSRARASI